MQQLSKIISEALAPNSGWFTGQQIDLIPNLAGAYILLLRLDVTVGISLPRQAGVQLLPGWYAYAGSARGKGGMRGRLRHHFRNNKKPHWHIDRLTLNACDMAALPIADGRECDLLAGLLQLPGFGVVIKGFGASDCAICESHLLICKEQ